MGLSGDILAHTIISPNPTLDIMQATGLALFGVNSVLGAYHFLVHSLLAVAVIILITPDNILRRMKILE